MAGRSERAPPAARVWKTAWSPWRAHIATLRVETSTRRSTWVAFGDVALEGGGGQRDPDQPVGDVLVGGVEGAQAGVGLPLLEHQLHLPAQPTGLAEPVRRRRARGGGSLCGRCALTFDTITRLRFRSLPIKLSAAALHTFGLSLITCWGSSSLPVLFTLAMRESRHRMRRARVLGRP